MTNVISKVIHNGTEYEFNGVNGGVTSVNGNTGAVTVNDVKVSASAPSNPTEGMAWYDTTNDALKVYDGSNWIQTGAVTSVNGQTGAVTVQDTLVSGTNIKTINSTSLLGSGNISVLTAETVVSGDSGTTYTIKVSASAPSAGTPNTTITFVTA